MSKEINYLQQIENSALQPALSVLRIVEKYTNQQWLQVQKNCWNIGRSEVDDALGKDDVGYKAHGFYLEILPEKDLKNLLEMSEKYIRQLQTSQGSYRPILRDSLKEILSFDNLTRFFFARKAAWICSAAIGEIQLKSQPEDQKLQLLEVLIDSQNHPLTSQLLKA